MIKKYFDTKLFIYSILSSFIMAFAVTSFSIPGNLYPGGFSGISRIISDLSTNFLNFELSYSVLYLLLNLIVTVFIFNKIGKKFVIYSIIQFSLVAVFTSFLKPIMFLDNVLLYSVFGGLINGFGVGIALNNNFSSGGFDFLSVYFSNKYKKSIFNYTLAINTLILVIAGVIFGWDRALYSIIYQYCSTQVIKSLYKRYNYITLTIFTNKPKDVSDELSKHVRHGITEIKGEGHFSGKEISILYTVVNSYQYRYVIDLVKNVDEHAFINVQNTVEIRGNYYQKPIE